MTISEIRDILKQETVEKTVWKKLWRMNGKVSGSWWMPISAV